jgi:hypothetical protein
MFSLCIATVDRFDSFLNSNLTKYLTFELIDEIVICCENGNDYLKIKENYQDQKIKVYKNETILGPFLNKLKACKLAKNEWIVLMDSDNFADQDYFRVAEHYIKNNHPSNSSILAPSFAKPNFNYSRHTNRIYKRKFMEEDGCLFNTGNYVLNKSLIDNLDITKELENIKKSSACDVIFFNTLLFEQFDLEFHIVKGLEYMHTVHPGSTYLTTCNNFREFNESVYQRFHFLNL